MPEIPEGFVERPLFIRHRRGAHDWIRAKLLETVGNGLAVELPGIIKSSNASNHFGRWAKERGCRFTVRTVNGKVLGWLEPLVPPTGKESL